MVHLRYCPWCRRQTAPTLLRQGTSPEPARLLCSRCGHRLDVMQQACDCRQCSGAAIPAPKEDQP